MWAIMPRWAFYWWLFSALYADRDGDQVKYKAHKYSDTRGYPRDILQVSIIIRSFSQLADNPDLVRVALDMNSNPTAEEVLGLNLSYNSGIFVGTGIDSTNIVRIYR